MSTYKKRRAILIEGVKNNGINAAADMARGYEIRDHIGEERTARRADGIRPDILAGYRRWKKKSTQRKDSSD